MISTTDLKDLYNRSYLGDVEGYTRAAENYLSDAIKRHNTGIDNSISVGLAPDNRITRLSLFSAEDTTSPTVELNYGLLKNTRYTVPTHLIPAVEEKINTFILGLSSYGFTVEPFWAYSRGFGILQNDVVEEHFNPVRCYRIKWSNA